MFIVTQELHKPKKSQYESIADLEVGKTFVILGNTNKKKYTELRNFVKEYNKDHVNVILSLKTYANDRNVIYRVDVQKLSKINGTSV